MSSSNYTVFVVYDVRLANHSAINSYCVLVGRLACNEFDPDQSSCMYLHTVGEEDQETVNYGYGKDVKGHVVGVVKLETIKI